MNNVITLEQAIQMTSLFRAQRTNVLAPEQAGKNILPNAETFERAVFDKILSQPGCTGLRIYYGMNQDLQLRAIVVGVNENDEDMLPASTTSSETIEEVYTIAEDGITCPPICATPSPLNP